MEKWIPGWKSISILFLFIYAVIVNGQTLEHPWSIIDGGGGTLSGKELSVMASTGQSLLPSGTTKELSLDGGFIPGEVIHNGIVSFSENPYEEGWNLVSLPLFLSDLSTTAVYPGAISSAFSYDNGYTPRDMLELGRGYWVKYPEQSSSLLFGSAITSYVVNVTDRWNLIGALTYPVDITAIEVVPPMTIQSFFFGFSNYKGYFATTTLEPGKAYWVKCSEAGQLILHTTNGLMASKTASSFLQPLLKPGREHYKDGTCFLTFTERSGRQRILSLETESTELSHGYSEFPPPPPSGIFDVRFTSNKIVETIGSGHAKTMPLSISSAMYPLTVSWDLRKEFPPVLLTIDGKENVLSQKGSFILQQEPQSIFIQVGDHRESLPLSYSLGQNYPNPFNPSTTIQYGLPQRSPVFLTVTNLLGQQIAVLVKGEQEAGWHEVTFDASTLPSGVYLYRIQAGTYREIKKLVVVR